MSNANHQQFSDSMTVALASKFATEMYDFLTKCTVFFLVNISPRKRWPVGVEKFNTHVSWRELRVTCILTFNMLYLMSQRCLVVCLVQILNLRVQTKLLQEIKLFSSYVVDLYIWRQINRIKRFSFIFLLLKMSTFLKLTTICCP